MYHLLASSLFDSPWLIIVIMLASAIAKWRSKRRQPEDQEGEVQPDEPERRGQTGIERRLQEFLSANPSQTPRLSAAPPPVLTGVEDDWVSRVRREILMAQRQTSHPPAAPTPLMMEADVVSPEAAKRFVKLADEAEHPPATIDLIPRWQKPHNPKAAYWRNARNARHAFAASVIFGPPKGFEP